MGKGCAGDAKEEGRTETGNTNSFPIVREGLLLSGHQWPSRKCLAQFLTLSATNIATIGMGKGRRRRRWTDTDETGAGALRCHHCQ